MPPFTTPLPLHLPAVTYLPYGSNFTIFITLTTHFSSLLLSAPNRPRASLYLFIFPSLHLSEPWLWLGFKELQLVGGWDIGFKVMLLLWRKKKSPSKESRDVLTGALTSHDHLRTWEHDSCMSRKAGRTSSTAPPRGWILLISRTPVCAIQVSRYPSIQDVFLPHT